MKALFMAFVVSVSTATAMAAESKSGNFVLSGMGARGWSLQCTVTKPNGSASVAVLRGDGNGGREVVVRNGISSASCNVQAAPRGPVTLTLESNFTCPYPKDDRGSCKWNVEGGQRGNFTMTAE